MSNITAFRTEFSVGELSELNFMTKEHSYREPVFLTGICQNIDGFNCLTDRMRPKSSEDCIMQVALKLHYVGIHC